MCRMLDGDVPHLYFIARAFNGTRNSLGENLLRNNLSGSDAARRPPPDRGSTRQHFFRPSFPTSASSSPIQLYYIIFLFPPDDEFYDYDVAIIA